LLVYILHQTITWAVTCTWISNHNCPNNSKKALIQTGEVRNSKNAIHDLSMGY